MDDPGPDKVKRPPSLSTAIRAARADEAERFQALGDLRGAELARLGLLRDSIEPVLAEVPSDIVLFDAGIVAGGERPRLFIDMISFVEMSRDRRSYRFIQDTRHGRMVLAEAETAGAMTEAITTYVARRLVEREQFLASLLPDGSAARPIAAEAETAPTDPPPPSAPAAPERLPERRPRSWGRAATHALRLGIDGLGLLTLAALVWLGMQYLQGRIAPPW